MVSAKRQLFTTPGSSKKAKTLTQEVKSLKRQVANNKPELRQQRYTVTIPAANTDAVPLLNPATIIGDEFKLHRIEVSDPYTSEKGANAAGFWGLLYSPKEGFSALEALPNATSPHDPENYFYHADGTRCRVWDRRAYGDFNNRGGGSALAFQGLTNPMELHKKWSIPMKIGTSVPNQADPTVVHNQVYYAGASVGSAAAQTLYVTIWFTDS